MAKPPPDEKDNLSEAARAKREEAGGQRGKRGDRTTLNIADDEGAPPDALGETLVDRGLISRHQLFNALNDSYSSGRSLREALVALGYITEEALAEQGL